MPQTHVTKEPVTLEGYQAVLKPGEWGYKLQVLMGEEIVKELEEERESALEWARGKAKNPKRVTVKPEPWEEVENQEGTYQVRFTWREGDRLVPVIVDTEGTVISDKNTPVYNGSKVKIAFFQKPYVLPTGDIGTSLKLKAIQIVSLNNGAGIKDDGDMTPEEAAKLFGSAKGFKVEDPNVEKTDKTFNEEDEF